MTWFVPQASAVKFYACKCYLVSTFHCPSYLIFLFLPHSFIPGKWTLLERGSALLLFLFIPRRRKDKRIRECIVWISREFWKPHEKRKKVDQRSFFLPRRFVGGGSGGTNWSLHHFYIRCSLIAVRISTTHRKMLTAVEKYTIEREMWGNLHYGLYCTWSMILYDPILHLYVELRSKET